MTLATKLALASIAMLTCVLGAEFVALGWLALRDARSHADEELQATTRSSAALFSAYYDDALRQSRVNFDLLLAGLGWSSRLNEFHDEDGRRRRILAADRAAVDDANARLDQFAEATGAEASIFVRAGDEFVRIASSLRLRDGTRALGTALDLHHPAYDAIVRGAEFNGPAMVFNHLLMTRYVPIWSDGKVVGIIVAGSSLTETMNKLAESLRLLRPVQSGLAYGVFLGPDPELGRMVGLDAGARIDRQTPQAAAFLGALQRAEQPSLLDTAWSAALPETAAGAGTALRRLAVVRDPRWNVAIVSDVAGADITRPAIRTLEVVLAANFAALVLLILVKIVLARHFVARPIDTLIRGLARFSAKDLSRPLQLARRDEIGRLSASMESFRLQLLGSLGAVQQNAHNLAAASTTIAAGSKKLSLRTDEQIDLLKYTFSAMAQLHECLRSNTERAQQATELAREASRMATHSGADVDRFVRTMEAINRSSKTIEGIVSVIDGIAFQTNILALNAAVEAARAGDQGRGFAVVASEVRRLAQRSAEAAREIKTLVAGSVGEVEDGVRVVEQAGRSIAAVVEATHRVSELFEKISTATAEQQGSIDRVEEAVACLDRATQQNVGLVKESTSAADGLMGQAQGLKLAVGVFRLTEDEPEGATAAPA